jgi:hypothetical protein
MRTMDIITIAFTLTALALGTGCTVEDEGFDDEIVDEIADEGGDDLDDGGETSLELRGAMGDCPDGCTDPPTQCHSSGVCLTDPFSGSYCYYPPVPTGYQCFHSNWCAPGAHCANYSCVPDSFRYCNTPPSDCYQTLGSCDWSSESCQYTPKAAGSACSDGNACTSGDECDGDGTCEPGQDLCMASSFE